MSRRIPIKGSNDEFDRLALNLNAMLDQIEHLLEGLRQVSNDIAHDLRTPLTRLRGNLELLQLHTNEPEQIQILVRRNDYRGGSFAVDF